MRTSRSRCCSCRWAGWRISSAQAVVLDRHVDLHHRLTSLRSPHFDRNAGGVPDRAGSRCGNPRADRACDHNPRVSAGSARSRARHDGRCRQLGGRRWAADRRHPVELAGWPWDVGWLDLSDQRPNRGPGHLSYLARRAGDPRPRSGNERGLVGDGDDRGLRVLPHLCPGRGQQPWVGAQR